MKLEQSVRCRSILAVLVLGTSCLLGELQAASSDSPGTIAVQQLVRQAKELEESGQWGKALELYEQLPPRERKPGSVGIAAGPEVAIMAPDGVLLPSGEVGEDRFRRLPQ